MNIYLFELKAYRKYILIWLISILVITFFVTSFYPIFSKDIKEFTTIINNLPESIRAALGMNMDTIGSILGYYAFILTFVYICSCIESMILGLSILSKEIREKTADFLLVKPVSRLKIVTSKVLSSITWILITNIIFYISFYFILLAFGNNSFNFSTYTLLTLTILFMQLIFFALGLFISVIILKVKAIIPISLGTVFGFYLLSTFVEDKIRFLLPFKYFNTGEILLKNTYELKYVVIALSIIVILLVLSYIMYKNKDIDAV